MKYKFTLSEEQRAYVKNLLEVDDLSKVRIVFEVDAMYSKKEAEKEIRNMSSVVSITTCTCDNGDIGPHCCN